MAPAAEAPDPAAHFSRRLGLLAEEGVEQLDLLEERRRACRAHHREARDLEGLRSGVGQLQHELSEVQVQMVREQTRALETVLKTQELELQFMHCLADMGQFLPVRASDREEAAAPSGESRPRASRSVMRSIATPTGDGGMSMMAQAEEGERLLLGELQSHARDVEAWEAERKQAALLLEASVREARDELSQDAAALEAERERLAEALLAFVRLRREHLAERKASDEEAEMLSMKSRAVLGHATKVARAGFGEAEKVEALAADIALGRTDQSKRAEILERKSAARLCESLEAVRGEGDARVTRLEAELRLLREKCAGHRQRRKFALEGLRADLSVVRKKLGLLEDAAGIARL